MRIAYIQPIGGASGDMMLGALTDLGMPIEHLENELARLNVSGYRLEARQETRSEMRGTYLRSIWTTRPATHPNNCWES